MNSIDIVVPNIGDFHDVEVIEVLIKPGDMVAVDQSLVTVESDKASMEIPSSHAGRITSVKIRIGDKVNEGSLIATLEGTRSSAGDGVSGVTPAAAEVNPSSPAPQRESTLPAVGPTTASGDVGGPYDCDMLVLGAGPGGYSAAFRAADLGMKTIIVERYSTLGGVCLNVGCIPSKALLHVAHVMDEARHFAALGVQFAEPEIDLSLLRAHKGRVVGKLTSGLAAMARGRGVTVVTGVGSFVDAHTIAVTSPGVTRNLRFRQAIIAAGSQSVRLPFLPKDARIVDSTGALELPAVPKRMLIIGGGIIGMEMATVYSSLGARIDVVEMLDSLMAGADRDLVRVWQKMNQPRFDRIMLGTRTASAEARPDGIWVRFEGPGALADSERYDLVLEAVGRSPNGTRIGAANAGVAVTSRGFIEVDSQMRTNVAHIFAIGDIVGQPMLAHKAVHEGHVAAEAAAGEKSHFDARVIPSVAYTDPEIAWVGLTEDEAARTGQAVGRALFPWAASGRAIANGRDEGFTKLLFDEATHRIVGGGIVGTNAGDLISEVALAIEMGADAVDIGHTIHPHPTLGESVGMAAEIYEGVCTDVPAPKKKPKVTGGAP